MADANAKLSRRAVMGVSAAACVAGSAVFAFRGNHASARRKVVDSKNLNRGNGAEPYTLDPHKIEGDWENNVVGDMFMGLMTEDAAANAVPGAAESFTKSADGLTYRFKIRPHKWSDGVPVTAHDFVFSFRRILDPKTAAQYASLLYPIKNAEAVNSGHMPVENLGVRAVDDFTLEMIFAFQVPYLPQLLTHYTTFPVPEHIVSKHRDNWLRPENIATNGAYVLQEWTANDHITLKKSPHFYDARRVAVEQVNFYPSQDFSAALKRFRAGEFDTSSGLPSSEIGWLRGNMPDVLKVVPYILTQYISFNVTAKPFNDPRVCNALSLAIDREVIAHQVMRAGEQPAYAFVPPNIPGYPGKAQLEFKKLSMAARLDKAMVLLAQAGYGPSNPLSFEFSYQSQSDVQLIAVALQEMWRRIGVETRLVASENSVHYAKLRRQNFTAAWSGWTADYRDAKDFLFVAQTSSRDMNNGRYSNPKFDALIDKSDYQRDPVLRGQMLEQAEQIMLDDGAFAPVFFGVSRNIVSKQVRNWIPNPVNINRTRYISLDRAAEAV